MAKKTAAENSGGPVNIKGLTFDTLTGPQKREVQGVRKLVTDLATKFGAVRERIVEVAPRVIGLFDKLRAAAPALEFVQFARMVDDSVPMHARGERDGKQGYQAHPTYYTLQYMQRVYRQANRSAAGQGGAGAQGGAAGQGGVRANAVEGLARTLATILQLIPPAEAGPIWKAVETELGMEGRTLTRLRNRVAATEPLFKLDARQVKVGNVIHMDAPAASTAQGGEALNRPGQNVTIPADSRKRGSKAA